MAEFVGKRIVITGGAGGIGVETARAMLDHGAHVVLVDIDDDRLAKARDILGTARIATWRSAIDTPAACAAALDSAGAPVAALIHLAGVFERDPFEANDHSVWDRAIAVNLTSAYELRRLSPRQRGLSAVRRRQGGPGRTDAFPCPQTGARCAGECRGPGFDRHPYGGANHCRAR
jgi:NAD(P)-dependent dehydrogenase (short-subunit alcohol dehydrogenase family)